MKENQDYEYIPGGGDDDNWHIRILTGEYIETVFQFGTLTVDENNEALTFSLDIISTPDPDLTVDNIEFQQYCGKILSQVLEAAIDRLEQQEDGIEITSEDVIDESQY